MMTDTELQTVRERLALAIDADRKARDAGDKSRLMVDCVREELKRSNGDFARECEVLQAMQAATTRPATAGEIQDMLARIGQRAA